MIKRKYYFLPTLLVMVAILYLSLGRISVPREMPRIPHLDKVVHCIIYAGFSFVLGFDMLRYRSWREHGLWRKLVATWLLATMLGGLMEYLQMTLTTYRGGNWGDMIANMVGATLGVLLIRYGVYPLVKYRQRG